MTTREEFGKYLLLKKLAEDPLGETFRAGRLGQQGLDQVVLLRVLNGRGLDTERLAAGLEERKEVQSALKSPNIGNGVDAGRVRGVPYVAYDYISGKSLATLIVQAQQEGSPFPTDHAMLISERIGLALAAAYEARHGGGRVHHGMVTPHLVMVSNEGETRLLGFEAGPALAAQAASLPPELLRYVAPELRRGGAPSGRSDVFSAGVILYELLTGKALPAEAGTDYDAALAEARLAADRSPLPQGVAALLAKSLAAPEARIADPPAWHKALARETSAGGYNATTFNLAFFMHNLFRDEIERESREIEAERTMEVSTRGVSVAPTGAETMKLPQQEVRRAVAAGAAGAASTALPPDDTASVQARYELTEEEGGAKSKKGLWIGLGAVLVLAAGAVGVYLGVIAPRSSEPEPVPAETAATVPATPEPEPQAPAGPTPEEIQAQIDSMFDEKAKAMEANLKSEYDERINQMQRQLEDAQKAATERAKRLEEAQREAAEARKAAAEEPEEVEAAPEQQAALDPAAKAAPASNPSGQPASTGGVPAPRAGAGAQAPVQPVPEPEPEPEPAQPEVKRGELVMPGPGVSPPRAVRRPSPEFPPVAARLNKEATVDVRVLVDENGKVIEAEIDGRKPGFGFGEAALDAARASTFDPPTKFGVPVRMWTTMRFVFKR
jgi:TonB family protein